MSVSTMSIIGKLRPRLLGKAKTMRRKGASYDEISRMLTAESGIAVGRETVRQFFKTEA